jgi:hypothetical protein
MGEMENIWAFKGEMRNPYLMRWPEMRNYNAMGDARSGLFESFVSSEYHTRLCETS